MLRDERIYSQPDEFFPERFLNLSPEEMSRMDPRNFIFGFGRRICPGMHLVNSSIWLLIACMITTLDIQKARDQYGYPIDAVVKYQNSVFRCVSV